MLWEKLPKLDKPKKKKPMSWEKQPKSDKVKKKRKMYLMKLKEKAQSYKKNDSKLYNYYILFIILNCILRFIMVHQIKKRNNFYNKIIL